MPDKPVQRWSVLLLLLALLVAACTKPVDSVPDPFSFDPVTGAEPGVEVTSEPATIRGINVAVPATASAGAVLLVNGEVVTSPATVRNGDTVALRLVSSAASGGSVSATLEVGGFEAVFTVTTRTVAGGTPDPFSFDPVTDAEPGATVTSEPITISGITMPTPASVTGGALIVNGEEIESPAMVRNGDRLAVQVVASDAAGGTTTATLEVGGVSATFTVTTRTTAEGGVEPFVFETVTDAEPGAAVTSNEVTISGIDAPVTATVAPEGVLVINGADAGSSAEVSAGDTVAVRVTASMASGATVTVTVSVGDESATFSVVTRSLPSETPDPFSFDPVTDAAPGAAVTSNAVTISGIDAPVTATVAPEGELVINGADAGTTAEVSAGDTVAVRVTASMASGATVTVTVTVGGGSSQFSVTTAGTPILSLTAPSEASPGQDVTLSWTAAAELDQLELTSDGGLMLDVSGSTSTTVSVPGDQPSVTFTLTGTSSTNPALTADATASIAVPLWVCVDPGSVITFEDDILDGYYREILGVTLEDDLTCADAQNVTEFRTPTWQDEAGEAASLVGMQHFVNLETFWAEFNDFSDLTPLSGLTSLQVLYLDGNRVTDLSPIAGLTNLTTLALWDNGPVRIDEAPGAGPEVVCRDGISDITPLAGLVNLETLFLSCNAITDLTPLASMTNLELVFVILNEVTSIEPLTGHTNLQALRFSENQVESVEGVLETLTALRWLEMAYNQLEDESLTGLGVLPDLFAIDLEGNFFTNMDPILANTSLPGAEGTGDDQEPTDATVSIGYNCIPDPADVQAALVAQGFEVVGVDEPTAQQRPAEDCGAAPDGAVTGMSAQSTLERQLQLFRERTGMR